VRYLLIGLGNIGSKRRALLGDRCVGTVDPFNAAADFRKIQDCAAGRYDAAILAVPNQVKLELLRALLGLGKHVLVEKPLLLPNREMGQEHKRLAHQRHAVWYTSYNHRFEPLIETLKHELDKGTIGQVYHGRLYYGNGTVGNILGSWREAGLGVLDDLGPHLLDLVGYLFKCAGIEVIPWCLERHEAKSYDHCVLATSDRRFIMEMSFLSWKNRFEVDLYGDRGSLHLRGLCKWGPSELTVHRRVFPSGVPQERRESAGGTDVSWQRDLEYFERLVATGETSLENDWWISRAIQQAVLSA
jgi:scyllo-inositol 2-dehydrogenase (NADP+)